MLSVSVRMLLPSCVAICIDSVWIRLPGRLTDRILILFMRVIEYKRRAQRCRTASTRPGARGCVAPVSFPYVRDYGKKFRKSRLAGRSRASFAGPAGRYKLNLVRFQERNNHALDDNSAMHRLR